MFNQLVKQGQADPDRALLVAVDEKNKQFLLWNKRFSALKPYASRQHPNYSRTIPEVDLARIPQYLGRPRVIAATTVAPKEWREICARRTGGKNKAVREAFSRVGLIRTADEIV
jgi:hypothetical protein